MKLSSSIKLMKKIEFEPLIDYRKSIESERKQKKTHSKEKVFEMYDENKYKKKQQQQHINDVCFLFFLD